MNLWQHVRVDLVELVELIKIAELVIHVELVTPTLSSSTVALSGNMIQLDYCCVELEYKKWAASSFWHLVLTACLVMILNIYWDKKQKGGTWPKAHVQQYRLDPNIFAGKFEF